MKLKMISIAMFLLLSACSNNPSESDIEKDLIKAFSSCHHAKVTDVKKINGMATERDNVHDVQYSFSLVFDEYKNAKQLAEQSKFLSEKFSEIISEKVEKNDSLQAIANEITESSFLEMEKYEQENKFSPENLNGRPFGQAYGEHFRAVQAGKQQIKNHYDEEYKIKVSDVKLKNEEEAQEKIDALEIEKLRINYNNIKSEFNKECRFTDKFASAFIISIHSLKQVDTDKFFHGGKYDFTMNSKMLKTDNGWMLAH